tara:strand:+ start:1355 stop:1852 length:498 start_codon:yes stop_codon:yes gene_type:complete
MSSTETHTFSINLNDIDPNGIEHLEVVDNALQAIGSQTAQECIQGLGTVVSAEYADATSNTVNITTDDMSEKGTNTLKEMITILLSHYLLSLYQPNGYVKVFEESTDDTSEATQAFLAHAGHEMVVASTSDKKHILTTKNRHSERRHNYLLKQEQSLTVFYATTD